MLKWLTRSQSDPNSESVPENQTIKSPSGLKQALQKTSQSLFGGLFRFGQTESHWALDDDQLDQIEENLIRADVGLDLATQLTDTLRQQRHHVKTEADLNHFFKEAFTAILTPFDAANRLRFEPDRLNVYLMVGVNGSGKTTTIGKLAYQFSQRGESVIIGAGDTFRAAAEDQLAIWADRANAQLIRKDGGDPAAVIYEAIETAKKQQAGVVIIDTAGRLQNKFNLMEELRKIKQVLTKSLPSDAVYESLLVLDATTGQNALKQAEVFKDTVDLTGVVLTKLDGSAKGGVVLNIAQNYQLPVKLIGIGEGIEDLTGFDAQLFVESLGLN